MWPAWTSTATPSGTGHPVMIDVLPEPSGLMENSRPPPLASSTNNFGVKLAIVVVLSDKQVCQHVWHASGAMLTFDTAHVQHRSLLTAQRVSGVRPAR